MKVLSLSFDFHFQIIFLKCNIVLVVKVNKNINIKTYFC